MVGELSRFSMDGIKLIAFTTVLSVFQLNFMFCEICTIETNATGKIVVNEGTSGKHECWTIPVPPGHFVELQLISMELGHPCENEYLEISIDGRSEKYIFCGRHSDESSIKALGDVTITHSVLVSSEYPGIQEIIYYEHTFFVLEYTTQSLECFNKNSFKCSNHSCVEEEKICDGVKDCENGADEIKCDVLSIEGVLEARQKAVSWLKQKRTASWGWKENTPRAVVALNLASAASFGVSDLEEQLMAKQFDLNTAVALLRSSLTNSELSMFINALLVTCHNPRQFYGNNLVKRLKEQVEESGNFTHPMAYLALCNANETWPFKATSDLNNILNSGSEYPFVTDLQAMAFMALSCEKKRSRNSNDEFSNTTTTLYKNTIQHFKNIQAQDGSFGNVYTTALITQALLSGGQEQSKDWKLRATIKYLMKELDSSSVDFLTTYLALPILNGHTFTDISHVNCSVDARKHGDDPVSEMSDYSGPKIRVQYSLYIDEKEIAHTISLWVPENSTASEVMELAEIENPKFRFEWKTTAGKMYVYKIADVTNDPEAGKFWLLYMGSANTSEPLAHLTKGPDELIMGDREHLVLWYKTATI